MQSVRGQLDKRLSEVRMRPLIFNKLFYCSEMQKLTDQTRSMGKLTRDVRNEMLIVL